MHQPAGAHSLELLLRKEEITDQRVDADVSRSECGGFQKHGERDGIPNDDIIDEVEDLKIGKDDRDEAEKELQ